MSIFASISKIGNIKSVSSSSIASNGKNNMSFGSNYKSALCECGGANSGNNELVPLDAKINANVDVNPSSLLGPGLSCSCN